MARPRQMSDEEILDIARDCFFEHGAQVSTAHIAGEVGLSQAALFKRFQTKENLLIQALMPPTEIDWMERVERGPTDEAVEEQLFRIGCEAIDFMRELMPRIMVLKAASIAPAVLMAKMPEPPPRRAIRLLTSFFGELKGAGRVVGHSPAVMAAQFMGAIHGRVFFQHMFNADVGPESDAEFVDQAIAHLWGGLAPAEES